MARNGTAQATQLHVSELAYYRHLQEQATRVPELQEQQQRLAAEIATIVAAQQHYREFLTMMHDLKAGDRVEQDGTIVRRTTINTLVPAETVEPDPAPEHPADAWRRDHPGALEPAAPGEDA